MSHDELTLEKLQAAANLLKPTPRMPRWKDLAWAQRHVVEREIDATENVVVRQSMREAYYCADDHCPYHGNQV